MNIDQGGVQVGAITYAHTADLRFALDAGTKNKQLITEMLQSLTHVADNQTSDLSNALSYIRLHMLTPELGYRSGPLVIFFVITEEKPIAMIEAIEMEVRKLLVAAPEVKLVALLTDTVNSTGPTVQTVLGIEGIAVELEPLSESTKDVKMAKALVNSLFCPAAVAYNRDFSTPATPVSSFPTVIIAATVISLALTIVAVGLYVCYLPRRAHHLQNQPAGVSSPGRWRWRQGDSGKSPHTSGESMAQSPSVSVLPKDMEIGDTWSVNVDAVGALTDSHSTSAALSWQI